MEGKKREPDVAYVPFFMYESEMFRAEKRFRRCIAFLIAAVIALFATNIGWLWRFSSCGNAKPSPCETRCVYCTNENYSQYVKVLNEAPENEESRQKKRKLSTYVKRGGG